MVPKPLLDFLVQSSAQKLKEASLARTADYSNTRKQIFEMLDECVGKALEGELLAWFASNREELRRKLLAQQNPFRLPARFNQPLNRSRWRGRIRRP